MRNLFSIHCIYYSDAELEQVRNPRRRTIEFQVIIILCLHFHFAWAVFYQTPLLTFEMVDLSEEPVHLSWETWTRLHFHRRSPNYLFAILVVLGKRYIRIWCWNDDIAMRVFKKFIVTLCVNVGTLLNITCLNSLFLKELFILLEHNWFTVLC